MNAKQLNRWNIILGNEEEYGAFSTGKKGDAAESFGRLGYLLDYIYGESDKRRGDITGGTGKSVYTVPDWVREAKDTLPPHGFEVITNHAIGKFNITELLADENVLSSVRPDIDVLKKVLSFKSVLPPESMERVKELVRRVSKELSEKMKQEVRPALYGAIRSFNHCYHGDLHSLDVQATIRRNLKTYDSVTRRIYPMKMVFRENADKTVKRRLILLVDESGSMLDSVINTALLAGILANTAFLEVKIAVFDTQVVDLTDKCGDITELLFAVQLGGGTDIGSALSYGLQLMTEPKQTTVVLISDLADGCGYKKMYAAAQSIVDSGAKFLALTALDYNEGGASYDSSAAEKLTRIGVKVAAKTPKELCEWIVANR
ncbi:MAG: VWA domain-containing protein [Clostridiales bacterium]|nr:VWA domain-containing protein [Clostridiales bacterium]